MTGSFITALAMVLAAPPASAKGADVEVVSVIEGDRGPGFKPAANVMGAVGPKHVVDFTTAGFTVRDKATGKARRQQSQLEFWRGVQPAKSLDPSPNANDPWMVYDPLSERWFATVAGTGTGESYLAVSSSADPLEPWRGASLPLPKVDPGLKIGVDRNGVYISCANGGANPKEALDLYVIPKADAIDKKGPVLTRAQTLPKLIYAAFPAVNFDTDQKADTPAVLLNNEFGGPECGELYLHRITWTDGRAAVSKPQTIPLSRSYAVPKMEGIQPEGGVRLVQSGGRRNNCAFVRGGSVFSCNGAQRTADSRPGVLWYEVRIKDGKLLQEGFVDSPDCDYLYPSIAVDERGNIGIGCTRTSKNDYPSVCVMMHAAGDAAGTMRTPVVAVKGTTVYRHSGVTAMNFSNYSTTCIDPSDGNLLWTYQGYANSEKDRQWCTAWAAFKLPAAERPKTDKQPAAPPVVSRSARSGPWSAAATWEDGRVPGAGVRVLVREGHTVEYDVVSDKAIRAVNVAGTLTFATDKDTRLDVGLIKIQPGEEYSEEGFDCDAHLKPLAPGKSRPALLVGTPDKPVGAKHSAKIRLVAVEGLDKESCPAIVCCGGRMDFHGAPLDRTWVKLGEPAKAGDATVTLESEVAGWRAGDKLVLTATTRQNKAKKTFTAPSLRGHSQAEERTVKGIDGKRVTFDRPLEFDHVCDGVYRGDVANLSRNVVVESADPDKARGHTMYHRHSAGSISYAEFRHLGKPGVLGRYSLHYHLAGDTMRGSSVVGASVWDSGNRWLTVHGTNYLVVRDCVGYQSRGHGFFLEDGTEVYNVFDRNLAVHAFAADPLPKQVIPFDKNDGSGFWWANSLNTFTRNVAAECDEYGYFFQAAKTKDFDPELSIRQPDGTLRKTDIRTLPFVRFEDNEAHCQRRHAFNLGGGVPFGEPNVGGVGPDTKHPFVVRNFRAWNVHWVIHPVAPSLLVDGLDVFNADYGVWRPVYKDHAYRDVRMKNVDPALQYAFVTPSEPLNTDDKYPGTLTPTDDLPPITMITHVRPADAGKLLVRGTTTDNGKVSKVTVNGQEVKPLAPNFAEWEVTLAAPRDGKLTALGKDEAGNVEQTPHVRTVEGR